MTATVTGHVDPQYAGGWVQLVAPDKNRELALVLADGSYSAELEPGTYTAIMPGSQEVQFDLDDTDYLIQREVMAPVRPPVTFSLPDAVEAPREIPRTIGAGQSTITGVSDTQGGGIVSFILVGGNNVTEIRPAGDGSFSAFLDPGTWVVSYPGGRQTAIVVPVSVGTYTVDSLAIQPGTSTLYPYTYAQVVPYNGARPPGAATVIWVGGTSGTPPPNSLPEDVWIHS